MMLVLDASVALARFHADETTAEIMQVFAGINVDGAWVPPLWRVEVASVLQRGVFKGRYDADFRDRTLTDLASLNIRTDPESSAYIWTAAVQLAHRHCLTVYDACYLELAVRRSLPLATLDKDLRAAASSEGVARLGL